MENINKILDRIKKDAIRPTPRWLFTLKNAAIWTGFLMAVLLGALAFSVILLAVQQTDFTITSHLSHTKLELFLGLLPIIWLVLLLFFLAIAIASIRSSWRGYKFSILRLLTICVFMSISLGTLFFIAGGSQRLENAFALNVLTYESIEERKIQVWSNPAEGYLSGKIIGVNDQTLILEDFNKDHWEVNYSKAFIAPIIILEPTEKVKIIGKMSGDKKFNAEEIRPWGGPENRNGLNRFRQAN
ncbi:MAG: hypothetical protein IPL46_22195 [Saprospiraceae bacterium]|nr:hypothetical protein [Saprospiraceae bacterium]